MASYQVVIKRIVSPDGKIIVEAKSVAIEDDGTREISQSVSVNVSSHSSSSSSSVKSSSSSFSKSSSTHNQ